MDPEDQAEALRSFGAICEQAVLEFGGTVVQYNEQGFLACFGFPVAFEDAAQRAARAGLRMLERLKPLGERFRRECEVDLEPWVGIHTGPAVVEAKDVAITLVGEAQRGPAPGKRRRARPHRLHRGNATTLPRPLSLR